MTAPGPLRFLEVITEDGESYPLWGGPIHLIHIDGVGVAPIRRILEKAPMLHGAFDRGHRFLERRLELQLLIDGVDLAQADSLRDRLTHIFSPTYDPIKLRATRDDYEIRQIDCYLDGEMDFPMTKRVGTSQLVIVPLVATNPSWYNPTIVTVNHALTNGATTFTCDVNATSFVSQIMIEIIGPLDSGLTITSEISSDTITTQSAIGSGIQYNINLSSGYKTVELDSNGSNQFSILNLTSLGAFSSFVVPSQKEVQQILSDPTATSFDMTFTAAGTSGVSEATVTYFKRYASL